MRIRTGNNRRRAKVIRDWLRLPDKCEVCHGAKGGVRGNENVIDGKIVCDYCHSDESYKTAA